jgi:hypothetical protein
MPPTPFVFALELSGQGAPAGLLAELAATVFRHVGCIDAPTAELAAALNQAAAAKAFGGAARCDVQFRTRHDTLEVLVSANGGRIWQSACAMPLIPDP